MHNDRILSRLEVLPAVLHDAGFASDGTWAIDEADLLYCHEDEVLRLEILVRTYDEEANAEKCAMLSHDYITGSTSLETYGDFRYSPTELLPEVIESFRLEDEHDSFMLVLVAMRGGGADPVIEAQFPDL